MPEMVYEHLLVERRGPSAEGRGDTVALVAINRPQKLNAFSAQTRRELVAAIGKLGADPAVGAIVLTGAGQRAFTAGQDLSEASQFGSEQASTWVDQWKEVHGTILGLEKPIVAAVNGYAVGAGFQIAVDCDLRIASENARFGMAEIDAGIPCIGGITTLWEMIGRGRTAEVALTGRMLSAREALAWGIVTRVVAQEQLLDAALEQARALAAKPRTAMRMNKQWLRELLLANQARAKEFGRHAHGEAYASGDARRAMGDFLAGRREGRAT